jgi:hypothetical protein
MQENYSDWREAVDGRLHEIYCITIDDAGISEEHLIACWQSNEMPFDFVERFGNKFDLDPLPSHLPSANRDRKIQRSFICRKM